MHLNGANNRVVSHLNNFATYNYICKNRTENIDCHESGNVSKFELHQFCFY